MDKNILFIYTMVVKKIEKLVVLFVEVFIESHGLPHRDPYIQGLTYP